MDALKQKARELLESGSAQVIIGHGKGPTGKTRPFFARRTEEIDELILDDCCKLNLAVYLRKPEVKQLGKPAVIGGLPLMKTILQLAAEKHFEEGEALFLVRDKQGNIELLSAVSEIETWVKRSAAPQSPPAYPVEVEKLGLGERWNFWQEEFGRCIKCYACRSSCPMCYCEQCLAESNQPQWIPVPAHALGSFEWHVSRAIHLAGRCVGCGACSQACPVGIPLFLINRYLADLVAGEFQQRAGLSARLDYPLSVYSPGDKEEFIK